MEDKKLKYVYLMEEIISKIENNIYKSGDKLDSREKIKEKYNLSDNTVNKALDELVNLGYIEKIHRKGTFISQRKSKTNVIAIINLYFNSETEAAFSNIRYIILQMLQKKIHDMGYVPRLYLFKDKQEELEYLLELLQEDVAGVILFSSNNYYDVLKDYEEQSKPIIFVDSYLSDLNIPIVTSSNKKAVAEAVDILLENHEKIICIGKSELSNVLNDRESGYKSAITKDNRIGEIICLPESNDFSNILEYAKKIYEYSKTYKTAIISLEPGIHKAVWQCFQKNNMPVDSITWASCDDPNIDYPENISHIEIIQDINKMADVSLKKIINLIKDKPIKNKIDYIDCNIIKTNIEHHKSTKE